LAPGEIRKRRVAVLQRVGANPAGRDAYYDILEKMQRGTLDVTLWMEGFLDCLDHALDVTETTLATVLRKARFCERLRGTAINERQRLVLNRMLYGFEGKLASTKWAKIGKCSHDTALRDIQYLIDKGVLVKDAAGGRSTSYSLKRVGSWH
jgi:Fic family protein